MEQIWQEYRNRPFQVLAIDCWNGNTANVESYIQIAGATYPVLRQGGYLTSPSEYGIPYDNYVVIDAEGIVRYTSVDEAFTALGRFHAATIRAAILPLLPSLAVEGTTWTAVKQLYRATASP